jgi:acetylornithine deacetylase/succinyl-diaminopimelate desuccinylase-like protein
VNAVQKALALAQKILELQAPQVDVPGLGTVGGTINLGVMQGGVAYNIVPDCCELWFDRRTVPGEDQDQVLAQVRAVIEDLAARDRELQAEVQIARPDWHWTAIAERGLKPTLVPSESGVVGWLATHHARVVGSAPEYYFTDGYNEMDFLINDMSIPTVQYGPGDSRLCHTDEERLAISDLLTCTEVYLSLIEDVAGV